MNAVRSSVEIENGVSEVASNETVHTPSIIDRMNTENMPYRAIANSRFVAIPDTLSVSGKIQRIRAIATNGGFTLYEIVTDMPKGHSPAKVSMYFVYDVQNDKVNVLGNKRQFGVTGNSPVSFPTHGRKGDQSLELFKYAKSGLGIRAYVAQLFDGSESDLVAMDTVINRMKNIAESASAAISHMIANPIVKKIATPKIRYQDRLDMSIDADLPDEF